MTRGGRMSGRPSLRTRLQSLTLATRSSNSCVTSVTFVTLLDLSRASVCSPQSAIGAQRSNEGLNHTSHRLDNYDGSCCPPVDQEHPAQRHTRR